MMNDNKLAVIESNFDVMQRQAKALQASGYFADVKNQAQAIVKVMAGAELGLPPFAAMTGIHIIKGKPVLGANLIATMIKKHPRYDYRVTVFTNEGVEITFYEDGAVIGVSPFTMQDAKAANLSGDNWKKFPRNMLFSRAISNGAKWFTPDIFGGAPVYTEGELGEVVDITPPPAVIDTPAPEAEIVEGEAVDEAPGFEPTIDTKSPLYKRFHITGSQLYGKDWDAKRADFCDHYGVDSSKNLTVKQVQKILEGMEKRVMELAQEAADANPVDVEDVPF